MYKRQLYKSRLATGDSLCDLTGGLGVDTYFFSRQVGKVTYVERDELYCESARSNFRALGATNIEVVHADATTVTNNVFADTYYIDPVSYTHLGDSGNLLPGTIPRSGGSCSFEEG